MRLPWLADAARATGYPVTEIDGWQTRGSTLFTPKGLVWHHTAGPATGDMPSLGILINGRTGLPGPLSQYGLGRSGRIYVVAAGRANHAGEGDWNGLTGNGSVVGIEAEHTGRATEPWPAVQLDAYRKLSAQILSRLGSTTTLMCAHREWARNRTTNRKIDPISLNMAEERARVAALMATTEEDDMVIKKVLQGQTMAFYREMQKRVNVPRAPGNPDYWGSDYIPPPGQSRPSEAEWDDALDDFVGALFQMAVWPPIAGGSVDQTARDLAAEAKAGADRANRDLGEIKNVIG